MQKLVLLFILIISFHVVFAQTNAATDVALIKAARQASNDAIKQHDITTMATFWYNDFVQVRGNATSLTGKDTIIATWKKLFATNAEVVYVRTPSQITISTNDTLAWETGTWQAFHSYSNGGNYSAMWRKKDNTWKIQAEIFVSLF